MNASDWDCFSFSGGRVFFEQLEQLRQFEQFEQLEHFVFIWPKFSPNLVQINLSS